MRDKLIELLNSIEHRKNIGWFIDSDKMADEIIELIKQCQE